MKPLARLLLVTALCGAFSAAAVAGPGPQFWNRQTKKPTFSAEPAQPAVQPDRSGLACAYLQVPSSGQGFSKIPFTTVRCTPGMMKNDSRCRQA